MQDGPWPWRRFCPRILFLKLVLLQNMVWWCNQGNQTLLTIWPIFGTRKHTANGLPSRHPSTGNKTMGSSSKQDRRLWLPSGVSWTAWAWAWRRGRVLVRCGVSGELAIHRDEAIAFFFGYSVHFLARPRGSITDMCGLLENHVFVVANSTTTRAFHGRPRPGPWFLQHIWLSDARELCSVLCDRSLYNWQT